MQFIAIWEDPPGCHDDFGPAVFSFEAKDRKEAEEKVLSELLLRGVKNVVEEYGHAGRVYLGQPVGEVDDGIQSFNVLELDIDLEEEA